MKKTLIASAVLGALVALPASVASAQSAAEETLVKVWETDFSGKPPFKRVLRTITLTEAAALEVEAEPVETEVVRVIQFKGKPPFRRVLKEVPVVDAASLELEEVDEEESKGPRRNSWGKRHR